MRNQISMYALVFGILVKRGTRNENGKRKILVTPLIFKSMNNAPVTTPHFLPTVVFIFDVLETSKKLYSIYC